MPKKIPKAAKTKSLSFQKEVEMAKSRKDNKGRVLRKGETQRSCDGKYVYTYTDPEGKRRSIYSKDIMELRAREKN